MTSELTLKGLKIRTVCGEVLLDLKDARALLNMLNMNLATLEKEWRQEKSKALHNLLSDAAPQCEELGIELILAGDSVYEKGGIGTRGVVVSTNHKLAVVAWVGGQKMIMPLSNLTHKYPNA